MSKQNGRWLLLAVALIGIVLLLPVASAHSTGTNDWPPTPFWGDDDAHAGPGWGGAHGPMPGPHHAGGSDSVSTHGPYADDIRGSHARHHHGRYPNETDTHHGTFTNGTAFHNNTYLHGTYHHDSGYQNETHYHESTYSNGTHHHDSAYWNGTDDDETRVETDRQHDDSNTTTAGEWDDTRHHRGPGGCR